MALGSSPRYRQLINLLLLPSFLDSAVKVSNLVLRRLCSKSVHLCFSSSPPPPPSPPMYSSSLLQQHSSESHHIPRLSDLTHYPHLELSWPPWRTQDRPTGGRIAFQQNRRALRPAWAEDASRSPFPSPSPSESLDRAQQEMKPPV